MTLLDPRYMPQDLPQDQPEPLFDLAGLLGSRLCHDLISPMGAIANGVELLEMAGQAGPEVQLIKESVEAANARLKFFRVAFGAASAEQRLGGPEIKSLLGLMGKTGRMSYTWQAEGDHARRTVKSCFLASLCLEAALPWGGNIRFVQAAEGWQITGEATRTKPDPALWAVLEGGSKQDLTPAQVHFALLAEEQRGRKILWEVSANGAQIRF